MSTSIEQISDQNIISSKDNDVNDFHNNNTESDQEEELSNAVCVGIEECELLRDFLNQKQIKLNPILKRYSFFFLFKYIK